MVSPPSENCRRCAREIALARAALALSTPHEPVIVVVAMKAPSVRSLEFRFNAGRLCLDLPATVRRRASVPHDVLAAPGGAARWLEEAGLVDRPLRLSPARAAELLRLREAIWV